MNSINQITRRQLFVSGLMLLILSSALFFWFIYRPAKIEEDCAKYTAAVSAASGDDHLSFENHKKLLSFFQESCVKAGGSEAFEAALRKGQEASTI